MAVLFSCKISHSIASYLERRGENLESLYDSLDIPVEFLKDPAYWLDAAKMEGFCRAVDDHFGQQNSGILSKIGHKANELRSWGVLDSVLRMMQKPQDIYGQPARFISYFVSPEPPIANLQRESDSVAFELPISSDEYPCVTCYLAAALESLPAYIGRPMAQAHWSGIQIRVQWDENQESLFEPEAVKRHIKPELAETIMLSLEAAQKELEEKNKELALKNEELLEAKKQLECHIQESVDAQRLLNLGELAKGIGQELNPPLSHVLSNVQRLSDYLVRAQQLVVLLVAQDRLTPQVREAMRRTDWEHVKSESPQVVVEAIKELRKIQEIVKDLSFLANTAEPNASEKVPSDLNHIVEAAIQNVQPPSGVSIDRHLFLDRNVPVFPVRMEQALINLLGNAVQSIRGSGCVRVVTRPRGHRAEIEITDTGVGMDDDALSHLFTPFFNAQSGEGSGLGLSIARSIVKMHEGNIKVSSHKGQGSTFTIDLPMM